MGLFKHKPTKREKELLEDFEKGKILRVGENVDNKLLMKVKNG